jgi:general transcription factor 3C polypeptide 3 (transcription factor C subunit 4)
MNPDDGFFGQWPPGHPQNDRRFSPVTGTFEDDASHHGRQQYPVHFPQNGPMFSSQPMYHQPDFQPPLFHHQPPVRNPYIPLIPLNAVEDLEEEEEESLAPFTSGNFQDPFNRAYATSGPAVFEGFIPANPEQDDEDEYTDTSGFRNSMYDREFESSEEDEEEEEDEDDEYERMLEEEEERERLLRIQNQDDCEVDADYSSEDAQQDEGDPDEMELGVEFEDMEGRIRYKRRKGGSRGSAKISAMNSIIPASGTRGRRGGKRGRPSTRGRGGHSGAGSTRGRKRGKPGREKGPRGPRAVADPGAEWKALQQQANAKFIEKDYEAALAFAQQAIQLNPEIFDAYNIASEIYTEMGREEDSIAVLLAGAPTKRDPGLWQFIIDRIQQLDPEQHPRFTDENKRAAILPCLNEIILLNNDYEARSLKLEIEADLGRSSKCVTLGLKMLKTRKEQGEDPDTSVLKIMAMMGTASPRQTRIHLHKLVKSFEEAIDVFTQPDRDPVNNELDWELINIYLDLLDRAGSYATGVAKLKSLSRWKQGRRIETFWDEIDDDREFDVEDEPRRVAVPHFVRKSQDAKYGSTLPLEIRVKLGLFRLRRSKDDFKEAMVSLALFYEEMHPPDETSTIWRCWSQMTTVRMPSCGTTRISSGLLVMPCTPPATTRMRCVSMSHCSITTLKSSIS